MAQLTALMCFEEHGEALCPTICFTVYHPLMFPSVVLIVDDRIREPEHVLFFIVYSLDITNEALLSCGPIREMRKGLSNLKW